MSSDETLDIEVAIIGMAGRFPGADSVEALWTNLRAGLESIRDLTDAELRAAGVDDATLADPRFVRRAADLAGADLFDASLFGFTPREAELMDPQFRVFLEDAWTALENAGHLSDRSGQKVGVFAGASGNSYLLNNVYANPEAAEAVGGFQTSIGNERDYLATHVSYRLDLRGPSLVVQTACSTSLVAIHLACQSLIGRECDVALAGGVSIGVPQTTGYLYEEGGIASPDGRCRAFDADAAGCVKGNGSGVVVLRLLADALRDGDTIRAVIKGSAVNNDGSLKVGFSAPGEEGQAGVIAEALTVAGVDPATIGYVEAHGTGTGLGDPVEAAALARAYASTIVRTSRCAIGSIKTNLGHLDAAAGVAGLIKAVLALEHGEIPPSLHFQRPNPQIDFASSAFYVNSELRPWPREGGPRRAGVSSFGIGGTNAHVVLEEAPPREPAAPSRAPQILSLSAASRPALAAACAALAAKLESDPAVNLADAAFTLQIGRKRMPWRRAVVARDSKEAIQALRADAQAASAHRDDRRGSEVAFLFPGQGAQYAGMARGLYDSEPVFREAFDHCAGVLRRDPGLDLREAVFARGEGADAALMETELAQPALFTVAYAIGRLFAAWGVTPAAMAGHSIGEYVAACLAGVMSVDDAIALVAERGRLMGGLAPGAMLAAQLDEAAMEDRLRAQKGLSLAAVNGPTSCVASGPESGIARLEADLIAAGVACRRLRTSHAFHSSMMDPILERFEARVRRVRLSPPSIRFLSNLTGTWITPAQATDPAYWTQHLRRTVRFAGNIAVLAQEPSRVLLEVGPGTTLSSLARQQAGPEMTIVASIASMAPPKGEDREAIAGALAALWRSGADVDWRAVHGGDARRRVPLPTYPFQRKRFWIDGAVSERARRGKAASGKNPDIAEWFYAPGWKRSLPRAGTSNPEPPWLLFDDGSDLGRAVVEHAKARGARIATVRAGDAFEVAEGDGFRIDPRRREDYQALVRALRAAGALPGRIVHLWCANAAAAAVIDPGSAQDLGFFSLVHLVQAIGSPVGGSDLLIVSVTRGLFDVVGEEAVGPERATLVGVCRVVPQEETAIRCRVVDLAGAGGREAPRSNEVAAALETAREVLAIASELGAGDREPVVAWRGRHRWLPAYERIRIERPGPGAAPFPQGGAFVLTGGAGPLELAIAERLAAEGAKAIVFLGCEHAPGPEAGSPRTPGVDVVFSEARVTDPAGLDSALASVRARFGRVDGVFHTAGSIGGGMVQLKAREDAERVLAPRLEGTRLLAERLRQGERLVLFSSAISATGVFGQADFCAASAFLDAFAQSRRDRPGARVLTIGWGTALWDRWQEVQGPGAGALLEQLREVQESIGITVEEGVDALWRALTLEAPQILVSTQDLEDLVAQSVSSSVADLLAGVGKGGGVDVEREGREVVPPASDTERRVAAAWSALLGIERVGRNDSFFDLGGNSLLAIQLASQLRKEFDIELTIARLFESVDLAHLASAVDAALEERRASEEVARLLKEIEALSEEAVREELARNARAEGTAAG